jgi:hypothetical protein
VIWGHTDRPTNQPPDQPTDAVSYRGATSRLKTFFKDSKLKNSFDKDQAKIHGNDMKKKKKELDDGHFTVTPLCLKKVPHDILFW